MPFTYIPTGITPDQVFDHALALITDSASIGLLLKDALGYRLGFYDSFNYGILDATRWAAGGEGTQGLYAVDNDATHFSLLSGGAVPDDSYIHGAGVENNRFFTIQERGYSQVIWEARVRTTSFANLACLAGLFVTPPVDYAEPVTDCAQFFYDSALGVNMMVRNHNGAETETDTGVVMDAEWHVLRMVWTAASILYYIDTVLVATHVTNLPVLPLTTAFLIRNLAGGNKTMGIDYVYAEVS